MTPTRPLDVFRELIFRNKDLQDRLLESSDQQRFVDNTITIAAEHGITINIGDIRAAIIEGISVWHVSLTS